MNTFTWVFVEVYVSFTLVNMSLVVKVILLEYFAVSFFTPTYVFLNE